MAFSSRNLMTQLLSDSRNAIDGQVLPFWEGAQATLCALTQREIFMSYFNMSKEEYGAYVKKISPNSKLLPNLIKAFAVGGAICCVGQAILGLYAALGLEKDLAATATSISLVFFGALLTGLGVYDDIAKIGGAGTLVPITGFANAVVSPALEFKTEGYIMGTGAKMFVISGPVIVYGISSSVIYGIILWLIKLVQ